jgi:hypothetical protein
VRALILVAADARCQSITSAEAVTIVAIVVGIVAAVWVLTR